MKKLVPVILILILCLQGCAQEKTATNHQLESQFYQSGQWANYGNDQGGMGYSPLNQINTNNVNQLKLAWTYQTGELATYQGSDVASKAAFEATPIMVNGALYFSTPTNRIFAAAGTGTLFIILLTVSFQAVKAALMNPVISLRSE